jgi:hypothetical protein
MAGQTSCWTYVGLTYIGQTYVGQTSVSGCGVAHTVARGPGLDPTPKPRMAFSEALISLLSDNRLKTNFIHL